MQKAQGSCLNFKRVVRINLNDYLILKEVAERMSITIAEALHLALEKKEVAD